MTPADQPAPVVKPGIKSSEFFLSLLGSLSAMAFGLLGDLSETGKLIAFAIVAAIAIAYTISRGQAKKGAAK